MSPSGIPSPNQIPQDPVSVGPINRFRVGRQRVGMLKHSS